MWVLLLEFVISIEMNDSGILNRFGDLECNDLHRILEAM